MISWLKKNFWNLLGVFLGLAGLAVGYILYLASLKKPGLTVTDLGPHSKIVSSKFSQGGALKLLRKDGVAITRDVYIGNIALWNSGDTSIRKDAVLKPISLFLSDNAELLEVTVNKNSRPDITGLTLSTQGNLILPDWVILEPKDGVSIQVMYSADVAAKFQIEGAIEGVKSFDGSDGSPFAGIKAAYEVGQIILGFVIICFCVWIVIFIAAKIEVRFPKFYKALSGIFGLVGFGIGILFLGAMLLGLFETYQKTKKAASNEIPALLK